MIRARFVGVTSEKFDSSVQNMAASRLEVFPGVKIQVVVFWVVMW